MLELVLDCAAGAALFDTTPAIDIAAVFGTEPGDAPDVLLPGNGFNIFPLVLLVLLLLLPPDENLPPGGKGFNGPPDIIDARDGKIIYSNVTTTLSWRKSHHLKHDDMMITAAEYF